MSADWTAQALCARPYPDADWFADRSDNKRSKAAIQVCRWCPVANECLQLALKCELKSSDREGIYGGLTPDDREALYPSPATKPGQQPGEYVRKKGADLSSWKHTPPGRNEGWYARLLAGETYIQIAATDGVTQSCVRKATKTLRHAA